MQCVHGHFREEKCSCICDVGYGGAQCAGASYPKNPLSTPLLGCWIWLYQLTAAHCVHLFLMSHSVISH